MPVPASVLMVSREFPSFKVHHHWTSLRKTWDRLNHKVAAHWHRHCRWNTGPDVPYVDGVREFHEVIVMFTVSESNWKQSVPDIQASRFYRCTSWLRGSLFFLCFFINRIPLLCFGLWLQYKCSLGSCRPLSVIYLIQWSNSFRSSLLQSSALSLSLPHILSVIKAMS